MLVTEGPGRATPFMSTCSPFTQAADNETVPEPLTGIIAVELNKEETKNSKVRSSPTLLLDQNTGFVTSSMIVGFFDITLAR
jgi:hypothetical protein